MNSAQVNWVRFEWDLTALNVRSSPPAGYRFSSALPSHAGEIVPVVLSAYASDPGWRPMMDGIQQRMTERIEATLGNDDADYIIAMHEENIVGVSGVAKSHWTDQNLLTGICVLPMHQRRGVGTHLLALSLLRLRELGLASARVYTQAGTLADRKIYPLFGSTREEGVVYPGAVGD